MIGYDEYVTVLRKLYPADEAEEYIALLDPPPEEGGFWATMWQPSSPIGLGLAVIDAEYAEELSKKRPELAARIRELRQDPEAAFEELRKEMQ